MIGVVIGFSINETFGGRRSSIGVHRRDGRLLPFFPGWLFFSIVTAATGFASTALAQALIEALSGLGGLLFASLGVGLFLTLQAYSR
jgi:hypothetical protein